MGKKIIPPNLGLGRRGDHGDGIKHALSVTSHYTPIAWTTYTTYTQMLIKAETVQSIY